MLWGSLCMNCGEWSFGNPVFISDVVDVCVNGCINGRRDVPTRILECTLMVNCFRHSMSWMRDGTIEVVGRCRLWEWLMVVVGRWKWSMVLCWWPWCRLSRWWFPVISLCEYGIFFWFLNFSRLNALMLSLYELRWMILRRSSIYRWCCGCVCRWVY